MQRLRCEGLSLSSVGGSTIRSKSCLRVSDLGQLQVLFGYILVDLLVVEAREGRSDSVSLSHFEILSEVLVSAPPVGPDHAQALVPSGLMEVGISHIVLLPVHWESSVSVPRSVLLVCLSESVSPVLDHLFLLYYHSNR